MVNMVLHIRKPSSRGANDPICCHRGSSRFLCFFYAPAFFLLPIVFPGKICYTVENFDKGR